MSTDRFGTILLQIQIQNALRLPDGVHIKQSNRMFLESDIETTGQLPRYPAATNSVQKSVCIFKELCNVIWNNYISLAICFVHTITILIRYDILIVYSNQTFNI